MFVHLLGVHLTSSIKRFSIHVKTHISRHATQIIYQLTYSNIGIVRMDLEIRRMKLTNGSTIQIDADRVFIHLEFYMRSEL